MASLILQSNAKVSQTTKGILAVGWIITTLLFWTYLLPHLSLLIPKPLEVIHAGLVAWKQGIVAQLVTSVLSSLTAIFFAMIIGLALSYLSTFPIFAAPVQAVGSMRVMSLTGITFLFVLATPSGYWLKIATLVFSIVVFLVNSMLQVIDDIPSTRLDHARTLGLNQFQVLYEVVVRGTLANAFDVIRMTAAMAWMMLTAVEANARSDGGIGISLIELARQSNYAGIFFIQLLILVVGIGQDQLIQFTKSVVCPYTRAR